MDFNDYITTTEACELYKFPKEKYRDMLAYFNLCKSRTRKGTILFVDKNELADLIGEPEP